jgi:hypothetical protein
MDQPSESRVKFDEPVMVAPAQDDEAIRIHLVLEDLKRYSLGKLSEVETEAVQTHLEVCEACQRDLTKALDDPGWYGAERRGEIRTAVDMPAAIKLLDPLTSTSPPQRARVIEISRNGMKLRAQRLMFLRTLIQIRVRDKMVLGVVRSCIQDGEEFQIGVRLVKDFPSC